MAGGSGGGGPWQRGAEDGRIRIRPVHGAARRGHGARRRTQEWGRGGETPWSMEEREVGEAVHRAEVGVRHGGDKGEREDTG